jgi:NAD(P)-dependent dehydrogenase (short-subunit alcohol dehydrogenase family)
MNQPQSSFRTDLFAGQTVLVTGASTGIGAAIALAFKAHGAHVIATASRDDKMGWMAAAGIEGRKNDVRDDAEAEALLGSLDRLDILVTAAGIVRRIDEYQMPVFRDVMEVNLFGTARFAFLARPLLARSSGSIITVASMLSTFGDKLVPAYAASKGAVTQLTKSLAIEYAADNVRVNANAPGWIETPLTEALWTNPDVGGSIASRTATKTWGKPEDIASGALFLASPDARYITVTTLTIDGGYSIT